MEFDASMAEKWAPHTSADEFQASSLIFDLGNANEESHDPDSLTAWLTSFPICNAAAQMDPFERVNWEEILRNSKEIGTKRNDLHHSSNSAFTKNSNKDHYRPNSELHLEQNILFPMFNCADDSSSPGDYSNSLNSSRFPSFQKQFANCRKYTPSSSSPVMNCSDPYISSVYCCINSDIIHPQWEDNSGISPISAISQLGNISTTSSCSPQIDFARKQCSYSYGSDYHLSVPFTEYASPENESNFVPTDIHAKNHSPSYGSPDTAIHNNSSLEAFVLPGQKAMDGLQLQIERFRAPTEEDDAISRPQKPQGPTCISSPTAHPLSDGLKEEKQKTDKRKDIQDIEPRQLFPSRKRFCTELRTASCSQTKDEDAVLMEANASSPEQNYPSVDQHPLSPAVAGPPINRNGNSRAQRGSATDPQSVYARQRRERINERLKILQKLVPNGAKVDISTMLEEAISYVKFLQLQVKFLSSDEYWMYTPIAYNGIDIAFNIQIGT